MSDSPIELFPGDITLLEVDAIVNAANSTLTPGGGVCGAIHRRAGPELAQACASLGGCPTGEARLTDGYQLKAKHVIHAVGPVWNGGDRNEEALLAGCYRHSLELAQAAGLRSIAFPAISTGIYGFPLRPATRIAVESVESWLRTDGGLSRVVFAVFGEEAEAAYREALGLSQA